MTTTAADKWRTFKQTAKRNGITVDRLEKFRRQGKEREELAGDEPGFFYIKLRTGGAWRLRYTEPASGARVTATIAGDDKKPQEAKFIAQAWRAKIRAGIDPRAEIQQAKAKHRHDQLTRVGTFFEKIYLPHLEETSENHHETKRIIERNFEHLFDMQMPDLSLQHIRAWETQRRKEGISRATLQRALGAFKGMLSYAAGTKKGYPIEDPVIDANPLAGKGLKKRTAQENRREDESREQVQTLSAAEFDAINKGLSLYAQQICMQRENSRNHGKPHLPSLQGLVYPHWFEPFYHIARLTGARPGDVLRLKWTNIQKDFRTRCKILRFKPNKTIHHENPTEVVFPITGELDAVLKQWHKQAGKPSDGYMFPSARTGKNMDKSAYRNHWRHVKKLGGLPADLDLYTLRHTFISERVNAGWPLLRIAKLVGHKNTDMITRTYYREDQDELSAMLQAMEAMQRSDVNAERASI